MARRRGKNSSHSNALVVLKIPVNLPGAETRSSQFSCICIRYEIHIQCNFVKLHIAFGFEPTAMRSEYIHPEYGHPLRSFAQRCWYHSTYTPVRCQVHRRSIFSSWPYIRCDSYTRQWITIFALHGKSITSLVKILLCAFEAARLGDNVLSRLVGIFLELGYKLSPCFEIIILCFCSHSNLFCFVS